MILISVDLPAPLSPTIAWTSPGRSPKFPSRSATTRPKCFWIARASSRSGGESAISSERHRCHFRLSSMNLSPCLCQDGCRDRHRGRGSDRPDRGGRGVAAAGRGRAVQLGRRPRPPRGAGRLPRAPLARPLRERARGPARRERRRPAATSCAGQRRPPSQSSRRQRTAATSSCSTSKGRPTRISPPATSPSSGPRFSRSARARSRSRPILRPARSRPCSSGSRTAA